MRLRTTGIGMAVAAAIAGPGAATAGAAASDVRIVTAPGATTAGYATPHALLQKGKPLLYLNLDIVSHDVVSVRKGADGRPLFQSALIGVGKRAPVLRAERLAPGSYSFFCSLHTNMKGKLKVV